MPLDLVLLKTDVEDLHEKILTMIRDLSTHLADAIGDNDLESAEEISDLISSAMITDRNILDILSK